MHKPYFRLSMTNTNKQIIFIFNTLSAFKGDSILSKGWRGNQSWWRANSALELLIGAVLVQNTNWKNVDKALCNFEDNLSAEFITEVTNDVLAGVIRPAGFQNQKAKKLKALFAWLKKYDFDVNKVSQLDRESLRKELLEINGIGNETADAMLVYVFNKTSFVIDAYARRIFTRFGLNVPKKYDNFREMIELAIPRNVHTYDYYHGLIVEHAKEFCTKIPKCKSCPLANKCKKKL